MRQPCVASRRMGTLYIGVTSDLVRRLHQHRDGSGSDFVKTYGVHLLVRYELFSDMPAAIAREKQLKRWHRDWKINLIESNNPDWHDLAPTLGLEPLRQRARKDGP
ncbi:putative endonuclease [Sphingomonas guangdongensis]|uniref:Putative endonuclease n=2 Tax=Sphingomonas guangdongensis TaxID=1141890 RepID=A0A285QFF8_9SPHN|nr:GIY-YIG nuclease family protein [Sphingomonas guangdongensis]SOB80224.1 putative endonuclease [Sphingomonas guangdongensis]